MQLTMLETMQFTRLSAKIRSPNCWKACARTARSCAASARLADVFGRVARSEPRNPHSRLAQRRRLRPGDALQLAQRRRGGAGRASRSVGAAFGLGGKPGGQPDRRAHPAQFAYSTPLSQTPPPRPGPVGRSGPQRSAGRADGQCCRQNRQQRRPRPVDRVARSAGGRHLAGRGRSRY